MADNTLKMKFKLHHLEFELEGDQNVVKEQFENFKSFISNDLLPKINVQSAQFLPPPKGQISGGDDTSFVESSDELPALKEVVLKDLPKTETDWILIYACYKTSFGQGSFTEENIKDQYEKTGRTNKSRLANLSNNIKSLLNKAYIKVHNDTEYLIKPEGLKYAQQILGGHSTTKTGTKTSKKPNSEQQEQKVQPQKKTPKTSSGGNNFSLDRNLNLRPDGKESLKDFSSKYQLDSSAKQIVVIIYYLKEILKISKINGNHIYTALDELDIRIPASLKQIITNTKGREGWLDYESIDDLGLSVQGRNAIKFDLQIKKK